jgi:peroxiredoxin Q/BCP
MRLHTIALVTGLLVCTVGTAAAQGSNPKVSLANAPREGMMAPEFSLPWANSDTVGNAADPYELWRDRGKTVVLAFYPADFTKGCTAQMETFGEQFDSLFGSDVVVLGISADSVQTHRRFASSTGIPFRLLADRDLAVARKYGSKGEGGRPRRTVFVIGPDGRVKYRNLQFNALDPKDYSALGSAVRTARGG